jgi:hypothetical protein
VSDDLIVRFRSSVAAGYSSSNCGYHKVSKLLLTSLIAGVADIDGRLLRWLAIETVGYLRNGRRVAAHQQLLRVPSQRALRVVNYMPSRKLLRFHAQRFAKWLVLVFGAP